MDSRSVSFSSSNDTKFNSFFLFSRAKQVALLVLEHTSRKFFNEVLYGAFIMLFSTVNVTGSWKIYLVDTKQASGQSNQTFQIVFQCQFLLHILIKQILSFVAVKFETYVQLLFARRYGSFYTTR